MSNTPQYPLDPSCLQERSAYDPIDDSLSKSDDILCNNLKYYDFYQRQRDDRAFCHQVQNCQLPNEKIVDDETRMWRGRRGADCTLPYHLTRGGNSKTPSCIPALKHSLGPAGYDNYNTKSLSEYLLIPCRENTFQNYVACDRGKCCSVNHQLFMNLTRRV